MRKWTFGFLLTLIGLAALQATGGCSTMKEMGKAMGDYVSSAAEGIPEAPNELDAPRETTGLVLVSASLRGADLLHEYDYHLDAASLLRRANPEDVVQIRPFDDDLVVFQGLAPEAYTLAKLSGSTFKGKDAEYAKVPLPPDARYTFTVVAGEARYIGHLLYHKATRTGVEWVAEWDESATREAEAWEALAEEYADSAWAPVIQRHLESARSRSEAALASPGS